VCAASAWAAPAEKPGAERAQGLWAAVPLHFEENRGQWSSTIRYAARAGAKTLFLTDRGAVLASPIARVDVAFAHANPAPRIEPLDRLPGRTDYFIGSSSNWHTGVPEFSRVAYRSVYPGVDVVYYGNQDRLEYDLVLRAGANPRQIRWRFEGAERLSLTPEGDLQVESHGAQFLQKLPVIYQQDPRTSGRRAVDGRYRLLGRNQVALELAAFDNSRPLVVDPVLEYGSFLGGSAGDTVTAVTTDASGWIYVAGYTSTADLQPTFDGVQGSNAGGKDAFVAAFDPTSSGVPSLRYLTYLGGGRDDAASAIAVDAKGLIYVTGTTSSSDFPLAGNSVQTTLALSTTATVFNPDAFIAVIQRGNGLLYSTYFGGTGDEYPYGIGVDSKGFVYVGGTTDSPDMPATANAYQAVSWGPSDVFFLKLDLNATSPVYASYLGGEGRDDGRGFAVAPNGLVYFAASTLSTLFPTAGSAYRDGPPGIESLIIGVLDTTQSGNASLVYSSYFGGSNADEVRQIALTADGRVLITGWTLSPDFPTTANAFQSQFNGVGQAFVARVNPSALRVNFLEYSSLLGGSGGDVGYGIAADAAGAIYVAGYTLSKDFPVTPDAVQGTYLDGIEAFLVKLNPAVAGPGALQYGTFLGGVGVHYANGVAVAPDGSMFAGGSTTGALQGLGPADSTAYQPGFGGGSTDGWFMAVK
jgi:hypothetical protein